MRTVTEPSGARVRVAFPPGRRRKGSGKLISILKPAGEKNPKRASYDKGNLGSAIQAASRVGARFVAVTAYGYKVERRRPAPFAPYYELSSSGVTKHDPHSKIPESWAGEPSTNPKFVSHAKEVTEGRGFLGLGRGKEYWQTDILGKTYQARKTKKGKKHKLPVHVSMDTQTGIVTANPRRTGFKVRIRPVSAKESKGQWDYEVSVTKSSDGVERIEMVSGGMAYAERVADAMIAKARKEQNPRGAKQKTREQVEKMQQKAVRFLREVVKDDDKADEIADMSISEYAAKKHVTLTNPGRSSWKKRHSAILSAARKKRIPIEVEVEAGGRPSYIVDGRKMTNEQAAEYLDLDNPVKRNPRRAKRNAEKLEGADESRGARQLYETFHQEKPGEVLEFQEDIIRRKDYAVLGELVELYMRSLALKLDFEGEKVLLASSANGKQMYFIGGNQDLSAVIAESKDKVDPNKDFIDLGEIDRVVYRARKEFTDYEMTDWDHKLGEHGHKRPRLIYDKLNRQMYMAGGEYEVKYEGIIH